MNRTAGRLGWRVALTTGAAVAIGGCMVMGLGMGEHSGHGQPPVTQGAPTDGPWDLQRATDLSAEDGVVEVALEAREATVEFVPGRPTQVWTYNGSVPGPLIEAKVGDELVVHFTNRLPEPTTIHWHGMRVPAEMDGTEAMQSPVPSGGTFEYRFTVRDAGHFWFHPHHRSEDQVKRGLYGAIRVRAVDGPALPEPRVVMLSDIPLDDAGNITSSTDPMTAMIGEQGNLLLVNGRRLPILDVRAGQRERLLIVNAAISRYFRLGLPGHRLTLIGNDGGLLPAPVDVDEVMLVPGERVDLLITPSAAPGSEHDLQNRPYDRGHMTGGGDPVALLHIRYSAEAALEAPALPAELRVIEALPPPTVTRQFRLNETEGGHGGHGGHGGGTTGPTFTINGETFPDITPVTATLGDTELWEVINESMMDHPFHLHGFFFQVEPADGQPAAWRGLKDSINIPPMQTVRLRVSLDGHAGRWMYHCHILGHAELGMMGELVVVDR